MDNVQQINMLKELAIDLKRKGDFEAAKKTYLIALSLDWNNNSIYYNLAKICYLLGEAKEAISNYMKAQHLEVFIAVYHLQTNGMLPMYLSNGEIAFVQPNTFDSMISNDLLNLVNTVHPLAKYILVDRNTTTHLGHAAIDLNSRFGKTIKHEQYINIYNKGLSGDNRFTTNPQIEQNYQFSGMLIALDNLDWSKITTNNVRSLYNDVSQMRFDSLKFFQFPS
jgi:tetratricopeptide (TPR) repeat protein